MIALRRKNIFFSWATCLVLVGCEADLTPKAEEQEKETSSIPSGDFVAAPESFPVELMPGVTDLINRVGNLYSEMVNQEKIDLLNFIKRTQGMTDEIAVAYIELFLAYPEARDSLLTLLNLAVANGVGADDYASIERAARESKLNAGVMSRLVTAIQLDHQGLRSLLLNELRISAEEIELTPWEMWPFTVFDAALLFDDRELALRLLLNLNEMPHGSDNLNFLLLGLGGISQEDRVIFLEKLSTLRTFYQNDGLECDPGCDSLGLLFDIVKFVEGGSVDRSSEDVLNKLNAPKPLVKNNLRPLVALENNLYTLDLSGAIASYRGKGGIFEIECPRSDEPDRELQENAGTVTRSPGEFCKEFIKVEGSELRINANFDAVVARENTANLPLNFLFRQGSSEVRFSISAVIENSDRPFVASEPDVVSGAEGQVSSSRVAAADPDGEPVLFSCISGCGSTTQLNTATGELIFAPGMEDSGRHNFTVEVRSSLDDNKQRERIAVAFDIANVNRPPLIIQPETHNVAEGDLLRVLIIAHDPDGDQVTVLCKSGCQSIDAGIDAKGAFTYRPDLDVAGYPGPESVIKNFVITASDGEFVVEKTLNVVVDNTNRVAILSDIPPKQVVEKNLLQFSLSALDPDGDYDAISFECHAGCPSDPYTLDEKTGEFSWRPGYYSDGDYRITFRVRDGEFHSDKIAEIKVSNLVREPLPFDATTNKSSALIGETARCAGTTSDPDGELLRYTYQWYFRESVESQPGPIEGRSQVAYLLSAEEVRHGFISCRVTADDSRLGVTESSSSPLITVDNSDPEEFTALLSPDEAAVHDTVLCQGETSDPDIDQLSYSYLWFYRASGEQSLVELDGPLGDDPSRLLITSDYSHGKVYCGMVARDKYGGERHSAISFSSQIINTRPTDFQVSTDVADVVVGDSVSCIGETTDEDTDEVSYSYAWYTSEDSAQAGSLIAEATEASYSVRAADARHTYVRCRITANDGWGGITPSEISAPIPVLNTVPNPFDAEVSSSQIFVNQVIECLGETNDADLDTLGTEQYDYSWFYRGVPNGDAVELETLRQKQITVTSNFAHGKLSCQISASDLHEGVTSTPISAEVLVLNTPPADFSASADRVSIAVNESVGCSGNTSDIDTDSLDYSWQWYVADLSGQEGEPIVGETSPNLSMSADKNKTLDLGHKIFFCRITASDGNGGETRSQKSSDVEYVNTPPDEFRPSFSGNPVVGTALACDASPTDPDGDAVSFVEYRWFRQNTLLGTSVLIDGAEGSSLVVTPRDAHGAIACDTIASDGRGGTTRSLLSEFTTVNNSLPTFDVSAEDQVIDEGEELKLTIPVSDADLDFLTASCIGCPDGASVVVIPGQGARFSYNPGFLVADSTTPKNENSIKIILNDGHGGVRQEEFILTVNNVDRPPDVTVSCLPEISEGDDYRINYTIIDPDKESVSVELISGFTPSETQKTGTGGSLTSDFSQSTNFETVGRDGVNFDGQKHYITINPEIKITSGNYEQFHSCEIKLMDSDRLPEVEMECPNVLETASQLFYLNYYDADGDAAILSQATGVGDGTVNCGNLNDGRYTCEGTNSSPYELVDHSGSKSNGAYYLDKSASINVAQKFGEEVSYQKSLECNYRITDVDRAPVANDVVRNLTGNYATSSLYDSSNDFSMSASDPDGDTITYSLDYDNASCSFHSRGDRESTTGYFFGVSGCGTQYKRDNTWRVKASYTASANGLSVEASSYIDVKAMQAWGAIYNGSNGGGCRDWGAYRMDVNITFTYWCYSRGWHPCYRDGTPNTYAGAEGYSGKYNRPPGCPDN